MPEGTSSRRATLSAVLIVKNEAHHLKACLATLAWADEIVVLDSGSSDGTQAIARQCGARLYESAAWPGYGPQRRLAQRHATGDWVLHIDADERCTPQLRASIQRVLQANVTDVIHTITRRSWVFGRFLRYGGFDHPTRLKRLYARRRTQYNASLVHERVEVPAGMRTALLRGALLHYPFSSLRHYQEKNARYAAAWAEQRHRRGRKASLMQGILHGLGCFVRM